MPVLRPTSPRPRPHRTSALLLALATAGSLAAAGTSDGSTTTTDLTSTTAEALATRLAGPGVTVANAVYAGAAAAAGTFETVDEATFGFSSGVILSTGTVADVAGPNTSGSISTSHGLPGDADLASLAGVATHDAAVLTFDFVPNGDTVFFQYVLGSDEYNEYAGSSFNDAFAFLVNGTNCARIGTDPVSINTVNLAVNSHAYRNNSPGSINTEMDGLTTVLTCEAPVTSGAVNTMKLAIADGSDTAFDSNVLIQAGTLSTTNVDLLVCAPGLTPDDATALGYNVIMGTPGRDSLVGTSGPDAIFGRGGNDDIRARGGDDCVLAGGGNDFVAAGWGDDVVFGQGGSDNIDGNKGADSLDGGKGSFSLIDGGPGQDACASSTGRERHTRCEA